LRDIHTLPFSTFALRRGVNSSENSNIKPNELSSRKLISFDSLFPDNEVDIDGGVDLESGDVLDHGGWAVDINNSLVDSHLISIPSVGSLTAWGLSGGDSQDFSWDSDWSFSFISLVLCSHDDLIASPLEWLNFSSLEGHSKKREKKLDEPS
jgi:hypothetical protein